jgi:hypothetical protein
MQLRRRARMAKSETGDSTMRAETQADIDAIKQSLGLLRGHL